MTTPTVAQECGWPPCACKPSIKHLGTFPGSDDEWATRDCPPRDVRVPKWILDPSKVSHSADVL